MSPTLFRRFAAIGVCALSAKLAVVGLRLYDGGGAGLHTAAAPLALLYQDAWLAIAAGALSWLAATVGRNRPRLGRWLDRGLATAYLTATFWMALNVPVARLFSTPATFGLLTATGGALADSIAVYLTPLNLALPALLWIGALILPARLPARPRRAFVAATLTLTFACALAGPIAVTKVATLGLHRNAVWTLLDTALERRAAAASLGRPPAHAREPVPCGATAGQATDLRELTGAARGRNILLVILESTAARFLAPYGSGRSVTPNLDALAAGAVLFENAYAAYPESIKGLFSLLCSRSPPAHTHASQYQAGRLPCASVASVLGAAGYHTGLFHSGRFVYLGMEEVVRGRGFAELHDAATIPSAHTSSFGVDDLSTTKRLLRFVDQRPGARPFFAVYMPIAGHHPYHAPGDGPRPFPEHTAADAYANDLFSGDAAFGVLRAGLRQRGLDDKTLYVVVGDHGEAFQEHEGNFAHALFLYEENLRIPFWFAAPGSPLITGRHAPQIASLLDLAPTLLALAGVGAAPGHEGSSLLDPVPRIARFFTDQGLWQVGLRDGPWKLIWERETGQVQLFDLDADPRERRNLSAVAPDRVARYRRCLD